jgi:hypothetical protein
MVVETKPKSRVPLCDLAVLFLTAEQTLELHALEFEGRLSHQTSLADELTNNVGTFKISFEVIKEKVLHAEVCV